MGQTIGRASVVGWGKNKHGQCDVPVWTENRGFVALAAGWKRSLGIWVSLSGVKDWRMFD